MLCDDSEYRKYKRLRQNVEIFVDYEGKVRCRTLRIKANSYVRRAFATAEAFSDRTPLDKQGYPCFQGVRGLRCRIHGIQDHRQIDGSDMFQHFSDMSPEQRRMQKRNLLMKGGLGLATIGAAVAVGVVSFRSTILFFLPLPRQHFVTKNQRKRNYHQLCCPMNFLSFEKRRRI